MNTNDTNDIRKFIKIAKNNRNLVYNGMTKIKNKRFYNYNIPKVVTNEDLNFYICLVHQYQLIKKKTHQFFQTSMYL